MIEQDNKYVLLTFDVESDLGSWTNNYSSVTYVIPNILEFLLAKNIKATFFCTAKSALYASNIIRNIHDHGHEIGCHGFQHETYGPPTYFIPGERQILKEEISIRIEKTTEVLSNITGENPVSARAPRGWGGNDMIKVLKKKGYKVDASNLSMETDKNLFPYYPDPMNWMQPGKNNILEVPAANLYGNMVKYIDDELKTYSKKISNQRDLIGQWPVLRLLGAKHFINFLKIFTNHQMEKKKFSVICIYFHPWEFMPMDGSLECPEARIDLRKTIYFNCGNNVITELETVLDYYKNSNYLFLTMKELTQLWEI